MSRIRFDKTCLAAAAILLGSSWTAWSCERPAKLDNDQIRHDIELLKSADADVLEQIDVFGALMCAKRLSVRDLAARTALASPNKSIQAAALFDVLAQKQGMLIEFIEEEDLPNDVRDFIEENIVMRYEFLYVDRNASCMGLRYDSECSPGYSLDITGTNMELSKGNDLGRFSLDDNGELRGYYKPNGMSAKIPAKIRLL